MALTCGDRESPSQMMRLIAVACNCVLFSAVVTGGLPQLCPSEISERTARVRFEQTRGRHVARAWSQSSSIKSSGAVQPEPVPTSYVSRAERCRSAPCVTKPGSLRTARSLR